MLAERVGAQVPRVCSVPEYVSSSGLEAVELAAMAGLVLDPWEAFVLERALGERADGRWAAFEVGLVVPRQNGKGAILEARELAGLFLLGERLMIHSAHEFATATEARTRMESILESSPDLSRRVKSVNRSHGSEGFTLKTGQRLLYRTRTKGGGRGLSSDFLGLDEAMMLPAPMMGALLPTLSARPNPQVWYAASAVDQMVHLDGMVLARVRERGLRGNDPSLAYFEWSVGQEQEDGRPFTPDRVEEELAAAPGAWAAANPGLGIRISPEHVENERQSMDARTFAVERLGVGDWPIVGGNTAAVFSVEQWRSLEDIDSGIVGPVCLAFDVTPDRSYASIAAAGVRPDGLPHVEVADRRRGTGWVADRVRELCERHEPVAVILDAAGPAASLLHELDDLDVELLAVSAKEHANACGLLFDLVGQGSLRHLGTGELASAVKGAARRPLGDAWAWSRKNSTVDISPLVACTLAVWGSATQADPASVYDSRDLVEV